MKKIIMISCLFALSWNFAAAQENDSIKNKDTQKCIIFCQIVHSQIGLDLERMQNCCDVHFTKDSRIYSENIFGKKDEVQSWILK